MTDGDIQDALLKAGWNHRHILEAFLSSISPMVAVPLPPVAEPKIEADQPRIRVKDLKKYFKDVKAVDGIDLEVKKGTVLAILGPNGAGKTTLIRLLTTLLKPDAGEAKVNGYDVLREAGKVREIIGLTGQFTAIDEILTGRENLEMAAKLYHLSDETARNRASELLLRFDLLDASDRSVWTYSGGMKRRLDLAASLVANPQILFLDEPTSGLDPRSRTELWHIIKELVGDGATVLLTTQYLEEADHLAHHIVVIDKGRIIASGTSRELKEKVGGDVLELHLTDHTQSHRAAAAIEALGKEQPRINELEGHVTMPIRGGASVLVDAVRRLDQARINLADIVLRRPTLDDVFLVLTGHEAEEKF